jgi:hypothetical protein
VATVVRREGIEPWFGTLHPKECLGGGAESHAGESRRWRCGNRGCEAHRFGESRIDAEKRAGDVAFARTGPKTAATAVVTVATPLMRVGDSGLINGSRGVARGAPLDGAWRSHRPPMNRAIPTSTVLYGVVRDHFETFRAHGQAPAPQEVTKLLLDKSREPVGTVAATPSHAGTRNRRSKSVARRVSSAAAARTGR